ncbi:MAG TPA: hypothetical protein VMH04_19975 [Candidatus Solibacter sp.]|nr:hypothetical protein [Candidatus Solibacter sp.]
MKATLGASFLMFIFCLLIVASLTLGCGGGSGRQLQSISISQTTSNGQLAYIATGTFSAPPNTVSPLPVDWTSQLMAPAPSEYSYTLTTQPFVPVCTGTAPGLVVAFAPANPDAPSSGSTKKVVTGVLAFNCP